MKRLITSIVILACANFAIAQQKFIEFSIDGKYGITDINGVEAVKPIYKYTSQIQAKNQIYLQDFSNKPDIIFNTITGAKQLYEAVYDSRVKIKNIPYSLITNKGRKFLLSEEGTKTINLSQQYTDFKNVGQYIIAKYYPEPKPMPITKNKKGQYSPPIIREIVSQNFAVLTNDELLKPLLKGEFKNYIALYVMPEQAREKKEVVQLQLVNLTDLDKVQPFDYILFSRGNNHNLYNSKMSLVKTFVLAKANENMLVAASEKIVNKNLASASTNDSELQMGIVPSIAMAPSTGSGRDRAPAKIEKKPFKQFYFIGKMENGNEFFAWQEAEEISNHILQAKSGVKMSLNTNYNTLTVDVPDKGESKFSFDPKTGTIYLPKVYFNELGLTVL